MSATKLADVLPLRRVEGFGDAIKLAKDWQAEAERLEEYALTLEYLLSAYRLMLDVEKRETERLRTLVK